MRNMWTKIGLGAATIFVGGMFVVTLGRQVKASTIDAFRDGGTVNVPLSILPFNLNGERVGSVRSIQVDRAGGHKVKTVNVVVNLKGIDASELGDCAVVVGGHGTHDFVGCVDPSELDGTEFIQVGSVRFEPSGVSRPIMIDRGNVEGWFHSDAKAIIEANAEGQAKIDIEGADGSRFQLQANGDGTTIRIRNEKGKEVVKIDTP